MFPLLLKLTLRIINARVFISTRGESVLSITIYFPRRAGNTMPSNIISALTSLAISVALTFFMVVSLF